MVAPPPITPRQSKFSTHIFVIEALRMLSLEEKHLETFFPQSKSKYLDEIHYWLIEVTSVYLILDKNRGASNRRSHGHDLDDNLRQIRVSPAAVHLQPAGASNAEVST